MHKTCKRIVTLLLALVTVLTLMPVARTQAAMKQGSRGSDVRRFQENLIGLGFLTGTADGNYGKNTRRAVEQFQAEFGLEVDGNAGDATQTALRNAVIRLQSELNKLGCDCGSADGHFGGNTERALKKFQKAQGLDQTGCADVNVWARINSLGGGMRCGVSIRPGSSASQVKQLQKALIGLGFLSGSADGSYGPKTTEAVRSFQRTYGLHADGSAGPDTTTALKNAVCALQATLARKGFYSSAVDGVYGSGTKKAVQAYQRHVGLDDTGIAGAATNKKLWGIDLGGSDSGKTGEEKTYKIWIDSLYQSGDRSLIYYGPRDSKTTTVEKSGCAGVATAMALNALLDTDKYTGQNVMQWFADNGYYYGSGTYQEGIWKYPRKLGLNSTYCDTAKDLISHLKKDRLAVALIKDKTGDEFFTYSGSKGHFVLVSGYRKENGVDQVFINNPLDWMRTGWFDVEDLLDNACNDWQGYKNSFVVIYN